MELLPLDAGVRGLRLSDAGRAVFGRCAAALEPFQLLLGRLSADERRSLHAGLNAAEAALRPPPRW